MTIQHQLFRLVRVLNKAEKRAFRLYAKRAQGRDGSLFLRLFDLLDAAATPDDERMRRSLGLTAPRYANLKRHLYREVLVATRLLAARKDVDCELRERLDFAHVLYSKGLYLDALRILERTKALAVEHHRHLLHLEALEAQKLIEARHITLSGQVRDKIDRLVNASSERSHEVLSASELSNVALQMHGYYIRAGHSRTTTGRQAADRFWREIQTAHLDADARTAGFYLRAYRFQAGMWYHYVQLDLARTEDHAREMSTLFQLNPQLTARDPDLYTRALYYVNLVTFLRGDLPATARYAQRLCDFRDVHRGNLNANSLAIAGVYAYLARLNELMLRHDFAAAHHLGTRLREELADGTLLPSPHRRALFRYRLAAVAFARGHYSLALDDLNAILNASTGALREDLLINTRLLQALCYDALGQSALLEFHLNNLSRYLRKSRDAAQLHTALITALRRPRADAAGRRSALEILAGRLIALAEDAFERKAMRYLDVGWWVATELELSLATA